MQETLFALDDFTEFHMDSNRSAITGGANVQRIAESSLPDYYRSRMQGKTIVVGWSDPQWLPEAGVRLVQS